MIKEAHYFEWIDSCVSPKIIEANVESFNADDREEVYHPALERLLGLSLADVGGHGNQYATQPIQQLLGRYRHIEFGGWWVNGVDPLNNWEPMEWGQVKPDFPRDDPEKPGEVIKYEACPGVPTRALFLQGAVNWKEVLADTNSLIILTEGAKKAGCALTLGYAAIALPGVWNGHRTKDEAKQPIPPHLIPDIEIWATPGRPMYIAFDQDPKPKTKCNVSQAITGLGKLLQAHGADVFIVKWKHQEGKGLDDLVKNCGAKKFHHAVKRAQSFDDWLSNFRSQGDSQSKPNHLKKAYHEVKHSWGNRLAYNKYSKEIELDSGPIDIGKAKLRLAVDHNLSVKIENLELILMDLAERNAYHPIQDYLEQCEQKHGTSDILESLSQRYLGTTDPLYDIYLKRTLIGAVARIFEPGCKLDTVLILQGLQGLGKSSFFKILAGGDKYFDDSLGAASDKDERLKLHLSWFVEWAELECIFKRRDISHVKAFITSSVDNIRPPYGRKTVKMARQSIIVGSTNQDEFLSDSTGNRRFLVIPIQGAIDLEQLRSERDQIWAAATVAYKAGESPFLTPEERIQAAEAVKDYQISDPWQRKIETYLLEHRLNEVTTTDILTNCLKLENSQQGKSQQMRVAGILKTLGWLRGKVNYLDKRTSGYKKPKLSAEQIPQGETESCNLKDDEPPLTNDQLCRFIDWHQDQPNRYQAELAKLSSHQLDFLYASLPELRASKE